MSLSDFVRILGRGPGRSRSMTQDEAHAAMTLMLREDASPEAVGAILMLLRMKGETAAEIAGFASAAAGASHRLPQVDLDWPSYAAGRTRGQPWFLLAAKLIAQGGHRVLLHGWNGADHKVRTGLAEAGIAVVQSAAAAQEALDRDGIAYLPLEDIHPALFGLLNLRDVLGLRSCVNTVCRMLNPAAAGASVQGVFHPSYRLLQADAAALLGWSGLSVIKGAGGEFERNPAKPVTAFGLRDGQIWEDQRAALPHPTIRLSHASAQDLTSVWNGAHAPFETDLIIETAALALDTLGVPSARARAQALWADRQGRRAA